VIYFTSTKWWCTRHAPRYVFLFLSLVSLSASSQVVQSGRYEIPVFESDPNFKLAPAGESGLFLYRTVDGSTANVFQLVLLDTAFREKWAGSIPIENNFVESRTTFYDTSLFVLMRWKDYTRNDFQIAVIK
jgi:hypothetical protein